MKWVKNFDKSNCQKLKAPIAMKLYHTLIPALFCSQLMYSSSQEGKEADCQTTILLPKVLKKHVEFQKAEVLRRDHIIKVQAFLNGEDVPFEPGDECFQVMSAARGNPSERANLQAWAQQTLHGVQKNIEVGEFRINNLMKVTTVEDVEMMFNTFVDLRNSYMFSRCQHIMLGTFLPSTVPDRLSSYDPLTKLSLQHSVRRHALMCDGVKKTYKVLLKLDQKRARSCFESIEPGTFLSKYLAEEITDVLDQDSCRAHDGVRPCAWSDTQVHQASTLLPTPLARHYAFQKVEEKHRDYLLKIHALLNGEEVAFDPDDIYYQTITHYLSRPDEKEKVLAWTQRGLREAQGHVEMGALNLGRLMRCRTQDDVEAVLSDLMAMRDNYFFTRHKCMSTGANVSSTRPEDFPSLHPLDKLTVQICVDRHAFKCEQMKEAYRVLAQLNEGRAQAFLGRIKPGTFLSKYLVGEVAHVLDPDSCDEHDNTGPVSKSNSVVHKAPTFLQKSLASHQAFQKKDEDTWDYALKIQALLNGEEVAFDPDDACFQEVCHAVRCPGGREGLQEWADKFTQVLKSNIDAGVVSLQVLTRATTAEHVEKVFDRFVGMRNEYFTSRVQQMSQGIALPGTTPEDISSHGPLIRLICQLSVDRHALMCEIAKEAYKVLLALDQDRARACFDRVAPGTFLAKYLAGEITQILDPKSCDGHDGLDMRVKSMINAADQGEKEAGVQCYISIGSATKDRLRRKLAQKQGVAKSTPNLPEKISSQESKRKGRRPSKKEIALIKKAAALERARLEREEAEKRRRIEAQATHAQHMKELVRQARLDALRSDSETTLPASSSALESTAPSKKRVKEKTRGVEDVNKRQRKGDPRALAKSKSEVRGSSGEKEDPREEETQLAANLYKRLVAFWESKAGQTYQDIALLFRGLGGRVTEKKGGSSHVTLTYYGAGGHKLKHELWRPHGGDNTFGFRTTAALQAFFEKCGLTLH
ncbi:MAG: hypothetical protein C0514_05715 [Candidatus Puniceispirillum sp.]|nr:hypothetical protein [Candidatus Puniceispirillum sp.]